MKTLVSDDKTLNIRAGNMTALFYKQEFSRDLLGDFGGVVSGVLGNIEFGKKKQTLKLADIDMSKLDTIVVMQIIWSMAKSAAFNGSNNFPQFENWLVEMDDFALLSIDNLLTVAEVGAKGLFHKDIRQFLNFKR